MAWKSQGIGKKKLVSLAPYIKTEGNPISNPENRNPLKRETGILTSCIRKHTSWNTNPHHSA